MTTTNLDNLTINYLTNEQYEEAKTNNTLDENQLYMTPDTSKMYELPKASYSTLGGVKIDESNGISIDSDGYLHNSYGLKTLYGESITSPIELYLLQDGAYVIKGFYKLAENFEPSVIELKPYESRVVTIDSVSLITNGTSELYTRIVLHENTKLDEIDDNIKIYYVNSTTGSMYHIDSMNVGLLTSNNLSMLQPKIDNTLTTGSKTVVGAINSLDNSVTTLNGKVTNLEHIGDKITHFLPSIAGVHNKAKWSTIYSPITFTLTPGKYLFIFGGIIWSDSQIGLATFRIINNGVEAFMIGYRNTSPVSNVTTNTNIIVPFETTTDYTFIFSVDAYPTVDIHNEGYSGQLDIIRLQ